MQNKFLKIFLISLLFALSADFAFGATLTVYPDASTGGTTVDGDVAETGTPQWCQARYPGSGDTHTDTATTIRTYHTIDETEGVTGTYRGILLFDTSDLTSGATISAAVLSVYVVSESHVPGFSSAFNVFSATPESDDDLVNEDYAAVGSTVLSDTWKASTTFAPLNWEAYTASAYNDFTLNASGISNISKTGISKFSTREWFEAQNTQDECCDVGGCFDSTNPTGYTYYSADQTGTDNDPKLVITYTPAANTTPTASSVTVSPKSNKVGYDFTFTGTWTESDAGDNVKMYICKDSSCTNCDNTSQTNCWCYSDDNVTQPTVTDTCTYTAQSSDIGNRNFYMKVCDDEPSCSVSIFGGSFLVGPATSTPLRFKGGVVLRIKNGFDSKSIRIRCL